ncbi:MAG: hypothetical protein J4N95_04995 [Chloroflexi bacterium]|nr:hypothetical protein [Chloroflexota bacterium]
MRAIAVSPRLLVVPAVLLGAAGAILWGIDQSAEGERPLIDVVQEKFDLDTAKGKFTGPLGDFAVYSRVGDDAPESTIECDSPSIRETVLGPDNLRGHELWSEVFGPVAFGVLCDGELIILNNGLEAVDGAQSIAIGYFTSATVPAVFDAPRDRLELIEIDGHPAVIEHALEGVPFARSSLVVIARKPSDGTPGIVAYVNLAESSTAAVELAKRMIP